MERRPSRTKKQKRNASKDQTGNHTHVLWRAAALLLALLMMFNVCGCGNAKPEPSAPAVGTTAAKETLKTQPETYASVSVETTGIHESLPAQPEETTEGSRDLPIPLPTAAPRETAAQPDPVSYTWKPVVFSEIYTMAWGDTIKESYTAYINAILKHETEFTCRKEEDSYHVADIARVCFPAADFIVQWVSYSDGVGHITYWADEKTSAEYIESMKQAAEEIITASVREGDTQAMAAFALYLYYASNIEYDYESLAALEESDDMVDISPLRGLVERKGICQSFAPAYAYLCLQCGIDACETGGLTRDSSGAHVWNLLKLNGKYYYMDPTYDGSESWASGRGSAAYFGMTAEKREIEGDFDGKYFNIGETNELWGGDLDVEDETYRDLWNSSWIIRVERKEGKMIVTYMDSNMERKEMVIE